ncbi:MAG: DNA repair protein RecN [Anaerovoracaceae bacterium]|jgi:DNA repair protein RecN (Recombination protein N)
MITHIEIRNFAIIDHLSLDFHQGFNIITGETGAGKSILIEAISMALGNRADTTLVRSGSDKAIIELTVSTHDPIALEMLKENHLLEGQVKESTFIISREIYSSGKSLCRIDGSIVSLNFLKMLCGRIADIHGQYDHQSLLNPERHINLLDRYGEDLIGPPMENVTILYEEYITAKREYDDLEKNSAERERRRDFMQFELDEIHAIAPMPEEDDALNKELIVLKNGELIKEKLSYAFEYLSAGDPSTDSLMSKAISSLKEIENLSDEVGQLANTISDCYYRLEDAAGQLRRLGDNVEVSEERLNQVVLRLDLLNNLKRKYGGSLQKVIAYGDELREQLQKVENHQSIQKDLYKKMELQREMLSEASLHLTRQRKKAALKLEKEICEELKDLNFKDATFSIHFHDTHEPAFGSRGWDRIEFLFSPNKGEPEKPLAKIASGGEISRIMLAFKRIIGEYDLIPTLIFDEIDTGISGVTASIVGRKLLDISSRLQVICITHLAQIAAFGDHHFRIEKMESQGRINTTVIPLKPSEKAAEIARLLGGIQVTDLTMKNAEELIQLSKKDN